MESGRVVGYSQKQPKTLPIFGNAFRSASSCCAQIWKTSNDAILYFAIHACRKLTLVLCSSTPVSVRFRVTPCLYVVGTGWARDTPGAALREKFMLPRKNRAFWRDLRARTTGASDSRIGSTTGLKSSSTMQGAAPSSEQVLPVSRMLKVQHDSWPLPRPLQPMPPQVPHDACDGRGYGRTRSGSRGAR